MQASGLLLALLTARFSHAAVTVSAIATFPAGTWVANLAPRVSGPILVTLLSSPQIYQVDPTGASPPSLVATIPYSKGCLGIDQFVFARHSEKFAIVCGNYSLASGDPGFNTYSIWKIDLNGYDPQSGLIVTPHLAAHMPKAKLLNGLTRTVGVHKVLAADSAGGAVWIVNMKTGQRKKVLQNQFMKATVGASPPLGINGIYEPGSVLAGQLYWTNTDQGSVVSQQINYDGTPEGKPVVIASLPDPVDLMVYGNTGGYVAGNDQLRMVGFEKPATVTVTSSHPLLKGSTAVENGVSSDTGAYQLFVTTNGGTAQYDNPPATNPGKLVRVTFN